MKGEGLDKLERVEDILYLLNLGWIEIYFVTKIRQSQLRLS